MNQGDCLTGKVFESVRLAGDTVVECEFFQLEAVIDGERTRLQGKGPVPEGCIYDSRHNGLELTTVLESIPPTYVVGCNCGYKVRMKDVNAGFRYSGEFRKLEPKIEYTI